MFPKLPPQHAPGNMAASVKPVRDVCERSAAAS